MQKPLGLRQRALIHREPNELGPEASTAELLEDVDVGEVRDSVAVRNDAREAHLAALRGVSGTVGNVRRVGIMVCVALPLAVTDLLVKATMPTATRLMCSRSPAPSRSLW